MYVYIGGSEPKGFCRQKSRTVFSITGGQHRIAEISAAQILTSIMYHPVDRHCDATLLCSDILALIV